MPCDQCTDPARCNRFGVCQQFRHILPSGGYLRGYGDALDHAAVYVAEHCMDGEQHAQSIRALTRPEQCRPGSVCSRSIRGLGGCEAGRCERQSADGWTEGGLVCQACAGDAPGGKCRNPKCAGVPVVRELVPTTPGATEAPTQAVPDHIARDVEQCESADRWNDGVPFKSRWERKLYESGFTEGWNRARAVEAERTRGVTAVQPWQVKVHCSRGERILRAGMQWHDGMSGSTWEVVEPEGGRIYSPSGFGGTPTFWCKPVGEPPEAAKVWLQSARADGCVSFCGDSIAAGLVSPHGVPEALPGVAYGTQALGRGYFNAEPALCKNCGKTWSQHDGKGRCPSGVLGTHESKENDRG